jgi:hypothetical protein
MAEPPPDEQTPSDQTPNEQTPNERSGREAGTDRLARHGAYRDERLVFAGTGLFLVPWTVLYAASSEDRAGALLLAVCSVALLAIAGYFQFQAARVARRPSDVAVQAAATETAAEAEAGTLRTEAPAAGAGTLQTEAQVAHPHPPEVSVWPLLMAGAATLLGLGLAFTVWVVIPAGLLLVVGVLGYAREA